MRETGSNPVEHTNLREDVLKNRLIIELAVIVIALVILEYILKEELNKNIYILIPIIFLFLFYKIIDHRITRLEELLKIHASEIIYIEGTKTVDFEFLRAIEEAQRIIMTTGGKSRNAEYLAAIEKRLIENENIEYWRLILTKKITSIVYEHLSKIIGRNGIYISFTSEIIIPSLLLTEEVAFICLPEPDPSKLKTCLKITNKEIIDTIEKYVRIWNGKGEKLSNNDDLKRIFSKSIENVR
jgi:hypothetical protein